MYCGFYKHEIEESLVGAELMFEAMGYRHLGHSTMGLPDILDPDRITSVSKDAIMAFVECQIMKQIWEAVSSHYNFTWLDILEFRENHTGTPDQAIRALTYKFRQRQYQEQAYHRPQQLRASDVHYPSRSDCMYGPNVMGYYSHMPYSSHPTHPYTLPIQNRYAPVISPQQVIAPPVLYQQPIHPPYAPQHHIIKPHDLYPSNGYHMHSQYPSPVNPPHMVHNGYPAPPMNYSIPSGVPTGQLIELDSTPSHDSDVHAQRSPILSKYASQEETHARWHPVPEPIKDDGPIPSGKAKDDGAGSWENWDYVYRNLESHGYKKDVGSRGDLLSPKANYPSSSQNNSTDLDSISDKLKKLNVDSPNVNKNESNTNKARIEVGGETRCKNVRNISESKVDGIKELSKFVLPDIKPHRTSPEKARRESSSTRGSEIGSEINKIIEDKFENENEQLSKALKFRDRSKTPELRPEHVDEKWECITCTYLNSSRVDICEMCYKSKERGSELKPQPSGGQECPKCTLVNEPGLSTCAVCATSLKDSPTYI